MSPVFPLLAAVAGAPELLLPDAKEPMVSFRGEVPSWEMLRAPLVGILPHIPAVESGGNRPFEFSFCEQVHTLVYFHVEEYTSGRALLEDLEDPKQAPLGGLPQGGVARSTFFEALQTRGVPQLLEIVARLGRKAARAVGMKYETLGEMEAIDGSLIEATLSMAWADYSDTTRKAKVHLSFDVNRSLPRTLLLTEGKASERKAADELLTPRRTGILDRGYQDHTRFDTWQAEGKHFVCRIRHNTVKTIVKELPIPPKTSLFFHAEVYLGDDSHRTEKTVRVIGFWVGKNAFWVVTDRRDLTALRICCIYRLRWEIEKFFAWWKRYLNVYHLISRSREGLLMQLAAGLITYLLLMIYFHAQGAERPSISLLRQLRRDIRRERSQTCNPACFLPGVILLVSTHPPWRARRDHQTRHLAKS